MVNKIVSDCPARGSSAQELSAGKFSCAIIALRENFHARYLPLRANGVLRISGMLLKIPNEKPRENFLSRETARQARSDPKTSSNVFNALLPEVLEDLGLVFAC